MDGGGAGVCTDLRVDGGGAGVCTDLRVDGGGAGVSTDLRVDALYRNPHCKNLVQQKKS